VHREAGTLEHRRFRDLAAYIPAGDLLAVNTTRVFRARLLGHRDSGAPAEVLLLRPLGEGRWEAMVSPGGKLKPGRVVHVAPGFDVRVESVTERRTRVVSLLTEGDAAANAEEAIERHGHIPLPPYIERPDAADDAERYQTVYSRESGSVAAPTAGLHFTPELLARLAAQGVERAEVLLHVGAGTFKPLDVEDPAEHPMHEEWYDVSPGAAARVNAVHARGGKVWAVGTTSTRTLESATDAGGTLHAGSGETRLFIYPPYRFRCVDHLVTNFHLPRSTLVMLVAAFAGYDLTMRAYEAAIAERYRFFSYGDAMLII
ncbi:MAG TPA: tRNA preQ1(34) S-adenosylmethionine ribosyltransferase-isomerase QueA, partial [Gemmatimonadaceae bacterium]